MCRDKSEEQADLTIEEIETYTKQIESLESAHCITYDIQLPKRKETGIKMGSPGNPPLNPS